MVVLCASVRYAELSALRRREADTPEQTIRSAQAGRRSSPYKDGLALLQPLVIDDEALDQELAQGLGRQMRNCVADGERALPIYVARAGSSAPSRPAQEAPVQSANTSASVVADRMRMVQRSICSMDAAAMRCST